MKFYETPLFIDLLLYTIYALIIVAVGAALWSTVRSFLLEHKKD